MKNWDEKSRRLKTETIYLKSDDWDAVIKIKPENGELVVTAKRKSFGEYPISSNSKTVMDAILAWEEITMEEYSEF